MTLEQVPRAIGAGQLERGAVDGGDLASPQQTTAEWAAALHVRRSSAPAKGAPERPVEGAVGYLSLKLVAHLAAKAQLPPVPSRSGDGDVHPPQQLPRWEDAVVANQRLPNRAGAQKELWSAFAT